jgi:DNA polymerase-3 subunit delta
MATGRSLLFLGPEIGEKQDAIEELRRKIRPGKVPPVSKPGTGFQLDELSFYAGETAVSEMVSVLRNGSLFSDARLIFIKNAEVIKKKDEVELLAAYMKAPQEDTTLIFLSEAPGLDKGLEKAAGDKRIFWERVENRKSEWVAAFVRRADRRRSPEGIEAILEMVENNTDALKRECSRLLLFLDKDRVISGEDVEKWLSHTREESAFTLFSRIAAGDLPKSIETLHTLLAAKESPQAILAGLTWCFRKFRDYLLLVESGETGEFEFKKIGLGSSKTRKDYAEAARRYTEADTCLSRLAEFDILLRSAGSAPEEILMDLLIYKLIETPTQDRERWYYY